MFYYKCNLEYTQIQGDKLFREIPVLVPESVEINGLNTQYSFIDNSKYIQLKNNDELTLDLTFWVGGGDVKLLCLDYQCDRCEEVNFASFNNSDISIEFLVDRPDFNDRENNRILRKIKNELKIGAASLLEN